MMAGTPRSIWLVTLGIAGLAAVPTILLLSIAATGSVGTVPRLGTAVAAASVVAVVVAVAWGALTRSAGAVARHDGHTTTDIWVATYVGAAVWLVGAVAIPLLILAATVNSDRAMTDAGSGVYAWWIGLHLVWAAFALGAARLAFGGGGSPG